VAAQSTQGWSPQRIQNELGIQARRQKVTLTEPQYQEATALVRAGQSPAQAVQAMGTPKAVPAAPKLKVSAAETSTYLQLRHMGKSDAEAKALIQLQRDLAQRLNMPSSEAVRQSVAGRNVTGEWPE
jgi:predicted house-cleaning NTP pyrophosphatase (Maf/HAM1 superfamily)